MFSVSFDDRLDESSLSNARRTNNSDDCRRWFRGKAVDERDMEALFFDLGCSSETAKNRRGLL